MIRPLLVVACLASLGACNMFAGDGGRERESAAREDRDRERDRDRDSARNSSRDEEPARRDDADRGGDRAEPDQALIDELEIGAREYRRTLPREEGPMTINDVRTQGATLIYDAEMAESLTSAQVRTLRRAMADGLCRESSTRTLLTRGTTIVYNIQDGGGETHRIDIEGCN
jgi:hypothetical protein